MRLVALACLLAMACGNRIVSQDKATGRNGRIDGAKAMRPVATNTWKARGIVTYPGGDRVDWHTVTLPPAPGAVAIELRFTTPRPGLRLGLDVFDTDHRVLGRSRRGNGVRFVDLERGSGPLYIRVYAIGRGDAGRYSLRARYAPLPKPTDWTAYTFDDPPNLPEVPEPELVCTDDNFDVKRRECQRFCPTKAAPPGWPGCTGPPPNWCPDPPDARFPGCRDKMPCPDPPREDIRACHAPRPCGDGPGQIKCRPREVTGRILKVEVQGSDMIITISVGKDSGVEKDWRGWLVRDRDPGRPLPGGEVTIIRVDQRTTVVKARVTFDQIATGLGVHLKAP